MKYTRKIVLVVLVIVSIIAFYSCASYKDITSEELEVTILHLNDHHSHLESNTMDITLDGEKTRVKLGGFPQVISTIKKQESLNKNPIILHAGDAMSGTIYYSLFKGKSDAEMMNLIDWDVFTLGNHEFDDGNENLSAFIDLLDAPVVSANVVPDKGSILEGAWSPYKVITVEGQKIGIIGLDIVGKTKNSSNPGDDIKFTSEIGTAQRYVDELTKQKINKIILVSHIGFDNAKDLASKVSGIDIIVSGDSHTLLGDNDMENFGLNVQGEYPAIVQSLSNEPVAIVEAWEYSKAMGVLMVRFNTLGQVEDAQGTPLVPLSDSFLRKNSEGKRVEIEGAAREAVYKQIKESPFLTIAESDSEAMTILSKYQKEKDVFAKKIIGTVTDDIPGGSAVRIPSVSDNPDSKWGHFTAQVVVEGMLYKLQNLGEGNVDAVIQNAGGVRIPLSPGELTTETVFTLLPFGNTLVTIEMTGEEIKTAFEQSIDFALNPDGSTGSFPYTAALRYEVKLSNEMGSRVSNIEIQKNGSWSPLQDSHTYIIGANNYIAGGKDGYIILGEIDSSKKIDTYIDDAQSFSDYVKYMGSISKPERTSVKLIE